MDLDEEDNLMLLDEEVRKDVIQAHPDLRFFLEPKEDLGQKRYAALEGILFVGKIKQGGESRFSVIFLFAWASWHLMIFLAFCGYSRVQISSHALFPMNNIILNAQVRYVQGMNEIVGTLYFVLAHDSNEDWAYDG